MVTTSSNRNSLEIRRAEQFCRTLARGRYENFVFATLMLPRRLRQPFYNVYAFCRTADDLADESASPEQALKHLEDYRRKLDQAFCGTPTDPIFVALGHTAKEFQLPQQPFDDLLSAFIQDQRVCRYNTIEDLLDYCERSANPVGRIVLKLCGCDSKSNDALSDEICTGLQLANHCQDISRDYEMGRIYLPQDEMDRFGVSEAMVGSHAASPPLRQLIQSECERAKQYLLRGLELAERVPIWFSGDVKMFAHGGLQTIRAIERIDYDVLTRRPTVGRLSKLSLMLRAALHLL